MPISRRRTPEKGRDYAKPRQSIRSKDFKAGDRVRHKKEKTLGTVEYAQSYGYVTVLWDDGERSVTHRDHVIHTTNVSAPRLPNGEAKEYRDKPHFLTAAGRKQYKNISAQGWQFLMTFVYPSGKVAQHFTNDGKTLIMDSAGHIEMIYPVGSEVFDIHKDRKVKQGYGSEPNPRHGTFHGYIFGFDHEGKQDQMISPPYDTKEKAQRWIRDAKVIAQRTGFKIHTARIDKGYGPTPSDENPGKAFFYHGSYKSQILARRKSAEIPGSFIEERAGRFYVLQPKKIGGSGSTRSNPTPKGAVKIYGRCLRIEAVKLVKHTYGGKPTKAGQRYFHDFTAKNAMIYGLPDGSILIKAK